MLDITLEGFWTEALPVVDDGPRGGLAVALDGEYRFLFIEVSVYVAVAKAIDGLKPASALVVQQLRLAMKLSGRGHSLGSMSSDVVEGITIS